MQDLTPPPAALAPPSPWLLRWQRHFAPGQTALDLACGSGRHVRWLRAQGLQVCAVDRDALALEGLRDCGAERIEADLEGAPWPLGDRHFDLVLVTNYLWRPLLPRIVEAVAPGGWLIYETFAEGHQRIGRPSRPDFLLRPGELLAAAAGLRIVAYEDGFVDGDGAAVNPRQIQRVAAVRERTPGDLQARYHLT
ncbi:methyltransferase domain-containing protein [Pelomonas sp. APW6]|uniref:Methyltransferase domain-containing protein n=1 Tax=Roseateles subflavus TaxID=3053353 RepID=A0ABT7LJY9_9BURK|nr:methyltransferase domain-containing protein [Pelomonas sp. APW6]MDL5033178.1 methyltransferase domain-containing protein [Pelomonas sp. APW6]